MFSLIIPSRPCITDIQTISANQFGFSFPSQPHFSHIVVFLLPGNTLPLNVAAAVYMQLPGDNSFRFLGAIGNEKPSAIFKVTIPPETNGVVSVGISVEPVESVAAQMEALKQQQGGTGNALVTTRGTPSTKVLAQRIIKNAFNFLASFAGATGGVEVVPLKSFEEWWRKFERRVENDPGFLERDEEN